MLEGWQRGRGPSLVLVRGHEAIGRVVELPAEGPAVCDVAGRELMIVKWNNPRIRTDLLSGSNKNELGRNEHGLQHQSNGRQITEVILCPQIEHLQQDFEFRFGWGATIGPARE